ncbi:MAG: hypothetical protein GX640_01920 [Fibrobacter sp.]|nr:hypothetical protein [Fibrobacter sp.]
MGRHRESVEMLQFKGKSHKTKAELEERTQNKFSLGNTDFQEPEYVACDPLAHAKWLWLVNLYSSSDQVANHITSAMVDQMGAYCTLFANQIKLTEQLQASTGKTRISLSKILIQNVNQLNRIGKDLLLDFFSQQKVTPIKVEITDPLLEAGFDI